MHAEAQDFIRRASGMIDPPDRVIEFGAQDVNGTPRWAWPDAEWLGVDIERGPGVNVVADITSLVPSAWLNLFDLGICTEVLEHVKDAHKGFDNLLACVKPGGHVLVTVATTGRAPHACNGGPVGSEWYRNIEPWELVRDDLEPVLQEVHPERGDLYLLATKCG